MGRHQSFEKSEGEQPMQIYWPLKSIPELSELSPAERRRMWRAAYWKTYRHWQTWVSLAGIGFFTAVGGHLGSLIDSQIVGVAIGAGFGGFIFAQVTTEFARPYLRTFAAP
jgi:hypothetical protein